MGKGCCDVKVSELKDGYRIEVTGKGVKEKCRSLIENCCSQEHIERCFQAWCPQKSGGAFKGCA